jgi:flagellar hook-associated protein 1 FlgK
MSNSFLGINTAESALIANQAVLDVISQNVSNVNTPGYSQQTANLTQMPPYTASGVAFQSSQIGTGVQVSSITRATDEFVTQRLLSATANQSQSNQLETTLNEVQGLYNEPGTNGLSNLMNTFFTSFQTLATNSEDSGIRTTVISNAQAMTGMFNSVSAGLTNMTTNLQGSIQSTITQANNLVGQIAKLNQQIMDGVVNDTHPNDLMDQRDQLISQLGNLVGVTTSQELSPSGQPNGMVDVYIGGMSIVQGTQAYKIPTQTETINNQPYLVNDGVPVQISGGSLGGMVQSINLISGYQSNLDTIASTLISQVNQLHSSGYGLDGETGLNFFTGTNAATIQVNPELVSNPNAIAAATPPAAGQSVSASNGDNASAISNLANTPIFGNNSILQQYNANIAKIGADAQSFTNDYNNQTQIVQQLQSMQSSVSGVNLDEQMTNMLQYQRSYQAAAEMVTNINSMLDSLLSMVQ